MDEEKNVDTRRSPSKGKTSPSRHSYPQTVSSRSTTTVVKEMLGAGATVVYDSLTPSACHTAPTTTATTTNPSPLISYPYYRNHQQHQQRKEQNGRSSDNFFQNLKLNLTQNSPNKTSAILTGRALPNDSHRHSSSTTTTLTTDSITNKYRRDSVSTGGSLFLIDHFHQTDRH